jgi:hypothetical protein
MNGHLCKYSESNHGMLQYDHISYKLLWFHKRRAFMARAVSEQCLRTRYITRLQKRAVGNFAYTTRVVVNTLFQ